MALASCLFFPHHIICFPVTRDNAQATHWLFLSASLCVGAFSESLAVVVQLLSCVWLSATPMTAACQASLSFIISRSLLKLMSIESVMLSNQFILFTLFYCLHYFPASGSFSNELGLHIRWPKYWSFSFSVSPSNEYSGLISLRIDWFDLLSVQGTL